MNKYLLSVVIPTKNRAVYADQCIRQVLACGGDKIQIVVQDNGTDEDLENRIGDLLSLPNISYRHTKELLSFVDNFDRALQMVDAEYVTMIGDDDGITSALYRIAEWAQNHQVESVKPNLNIVYFWPGSKVLAQADTGRLQIDVNSASLKWADPHAGVVHLLKNGCQDYLECDLVKIYHGIVSKKLLDRVKEKIGRYVGGLSPDIYLSVALSLVSRQQMAVVDIPLTISGICKGSGSSQSSTGEHTGKLEDAPHFRGHKNYQWKLDVPGFYSVETIWADSALAAIEDLDPRMRKHYRSGRLVWDTMRKYPSYRKQIWKSYTDDGGNGLTYGTRGICEFARRIRRSVVYRLGDHERHVFDCGNIDTASQVCETELKADYTRFMEKYNEAKIPKL